MGWCPYSLSKINVVASSPKPFILCLFDLPSLVEHPILNEVNGKTLLTLTVEYFFPFGAKEYPVA